MMSGAARTALRTIEELRLQHGGSLASPVPLGNGSLRIEVNGVQHDALVEHGLDPAKADNRIIEQRSANLVKRQQ